MSDTIIFPARFNGGPGFAQGGYLAGTMAELVGGPARTTFRAPTPIEVPLTIVRDGDKVQLTTVDGTVTVFAESAEVNVSVPDVPDLESVIAARPDYRALQDQGTQLRPEDTCFVCSPKRFRPDGVELHAAPLGDGSLVASTWMPEDQYADDGVIKDVFIWAVLDCPSGFGAMERIKSEYDLIFTGQLAANILAPVHVGEPHLALGWHIGSEGRKHSAASAICDLAGNLKAVSESLWIVTEKKS